jgi:hypothetical protein
MRGKSDVMIITVWLDGKRAGTFGEYMNNVNFFLSNANKRFNEERIRYTQKLKSLPLS